MLKRKIVSELIDWKNNHKNKCLLVIGARQIGKTFIIREFAKENYDYFYEINFLENEKQKEIFKDDLSVDNIIKEISLRIPTFKVDDGKTLLFLDEIQECPQAITALKFLAQDKRFDCIASGSMLGMAYKRTSSFPVGYIDRIYMNSLDFEEFLWAKGVTDETINYIKEFYDNKKQVNMFAHNGMFELFREYIVLGGMPEVINEFLASNNFNVALNIQKEILDGYRDDIIKYAPEDEKVKIRACFDSIPVQLAKDNKKFRYNLVQKKADKSKLFNSLEWLYDAGIINFCYNLRNPEAQHFLNPLSPVFCGKQTEYRKFRKAADFPHRCS